MKQIQTRKIAAILLDAKQRRLHAPFGPRGEYESANVIELTELALAKT